MDPNIVNDICVVIAISILLIKINHV